MLLFFIDIFLISDSVYIHPYNIPKKEFSVTHYLIFWLMLNRIN